MLQTHRFRRTALLIGILALTIVLAGIRQVPYLTAMKTFRPPVAIVIDPGHGGYDPGKVSDDQVMEKDINLQIAFKLKTYLEAQDCIVYLTRETDTSLCDAGDKNKKISDMRNRIAYIDNIQPTLMISIHQNSYPANDVRGAQVFYYHSSDNSEYLASCIQNSIIKSVDPDNHRTHKSNSSYYILKNVNCTSVLVECGFLSCPSECALLCSDEYQEQLAYALAAGIRTYLNTCEP